MSTQNRRADNAQSDRPCQSPDRAALVLRFSRRSRTPLLQVSFISLAGLRASRLWRTIALLLLVSAVPGRYVWLGNAFDRRLTRSIAIPGLSLSESVVRRLTGQVSSNFSRRATSAS